MNQNGGREKGVGLGTEWTGHADLCGKIQGKAEETGKTPWFWYEQVSSGFIACKRRSYINPEVGFKATLNPLLFFW